MARQTVQVKTELLEWAFQRSRKDLESILKRFPKYKEWCEGGVFPTLKQLESFAKATYTPIGLFFLPQPPDEHVPIPDFRTVKNESIEQPSPDLLDTIFICQQRQEWYRDYARSMGEEKLSFVGSVRQSDKVVKVAEDIRTTLGFDVAERKSMGTWTDALRRFIEQADGLGILVMVSGVVKNNNKRKLDPQEFRGFALADDFAPLVFVNGSDTKAGQMFTLAHELVHIWLGRSGISDTQALQLPNNKIEQWCNRVAAELLVPIKMIRKEYNGDRSLSDEVNRLARIFKVSSLVILRRIHDAGGLTKDQFWRAYHEEVEFLISRRSGSGGDFYLTQGARLSKRFARALVASTLGGQTLQRDALHMLGFSKIKTFRDLGQRLGVN